jgi:hypothetical protein
MEDTSYNFEDGEDLIPEKYNELVVPTGYGDGHAWYYTEGSALHVDSEYDEPAILCIPQGKRICYLVLDALMKKAQETKSDEIIFHGPNDALDNVLSKYAKTAGLEIEKTPDYIDTTQNIKAISEITLKLNQPAKSL